MAGSKKRRAMAPPAPPSRGFGGSDNPFAATWERRAANAASRDSAARAAARARNAFADRRIGEDDAALPEEERYIMRLQKGRASRAAKRARFGLHEEGGEEGEAGFDGLTHRGVALDAGVEGAGKKVSILRDDYVEIGEDDGDEEEEEEVLGSGRMGDGEGLLRRKGEGGSEGEGSDEDEPREGRTRQEIMAEVVAKSKMHKADRQREKAHVDEETSALDKQLPDILRMLNSSGAGLRGEKDDEGSRGIFDAEGEQGAARPAPGDAGKVIGSGRMSGNKNTSGVAPAGAKGEEERFNYEQVYLELAGEKRAYATDRTKTQDEKDADERARLEALEKLRLHRMSAIDDEDAAEEGETGRGAAAQRRQKAAKRVGGKGGKKAHVGGDDLEDDFALGDDDSDCEDGSGSESDDGDMSDDESGESGLGSADEGARTRSLPLAGNRASRSKPAGGAVLPGRGLLKDDVPIADLEWVPPPAVATAPNDSLPFIYTDCPQSYTALSEVFKGLTAAQCGVAMSRLRKCFALSLNPAANRGILTSLLRATLKLFDVASLAVSASPSALTAAVSQVDALLPHVYELATVSPELLVSWARNHLEDAYRNTTEADNDTANAGISARLPAGKIIALRSIVRLFPGSDLRHAIVTPLGLLLSHCVSSVSVVTLEDASTSCFCAALLLEVLAPAQRFSGELACFLGSMLATAVPSGSRGSDPADRRNVRGDLLLGAGGKKAGVLALSDCFDASPASEEDASSSAKSYRKKKKQRVLNALYSMCRAYLFDGSLKSLRVAMAPVVKTLRALSAAKVCDSALLDEIERMADEQEGSRNALTLYTEKKGTVVPRMLNPKFRSENGIYAGKQRSAGGVAMSDMETQRRLRQQLKKETRSAARELRRDADAVGAVRIRNEDERDAVRTVKTAQVRAFMERQQHDAKLQSKKIAVGRDGLAAAGRKRKKW